MTLLKYNCLVSLLFVLCSVYLLLYFATYSSDKCVVADATTTTTTTSTTDSSNSTNQQNSTTNDTANTTVLRFIFDTNYSFEYYMRQLQDDTTSTAAVDTEELKGTKYTTLPLIQALAYAFCFFFGMIHVIGLNCFCDYEPERFANLGTIKGCFSVLVRLMPGLIGFFHYIIFLLILVQFFLLNTENNCKTAQHENSDGTISTGDMYEQGSFTNLVLFFVWIFLNFICPVYKATLPILPFSYAPVNYQATGVKRFLCYMGPL